MPTTILAIARNTLLESIRQPIYFALVALCGFFSILNTWATGFSMGYSNVPGEVTGDDKLLLELALATVLVCGILLAAFIATSVISREIDKKTVLTVVSKPVGRPAVILGKYLGVAAAMTIAVAVMVLMMLFSVQHGVLTTVRDLVDQPVIAFGVGGFALAVVLAAVLNYMYGWAFGQSAVLIALPVMLVGYLISLGLDPEWKLQPVATDFKPDVTKAGVAVLIGLLVISAVATAASTRLGQVMTIVVCAGVFLAGLLSNHFLGRLAFENRPVGRVFQVEADNPRQLFDIPGPEARRLARERAEAAFRASAEASGNSLEQEIGMPLEQFFNSAGFRVADYISRDEALRHADRSQTDAAEILFTAPGSTHRVTLEVPPTVQIRPGTPFYYGPGPNGVGMIPPDFGPVPADLDLAADRADRPVLVIADTDGAVLTVRNIGGLPVSRPPFPDDFVFTEPPRINPVAFAAWTLVPNMNFFYLADPISQAVDIPNTHLALVALYGLLQITIFLALAVLLFQTRDVG